MKKERGETPMRGRSRFLCLLVFVLFVTSSCSADDRTVKVVGHGECADCKEYNIKSSQAFSGLRVTVDCKLKNGEMKRRGSGELDAEGKFEVSISKEILKDGKLDDQDCHAQLYSASAAPCPAHNGLEASKIVLKSGPDGKLTFGPARKVKFSSALCTSAFWPFVKHPPFPKGHPWFSHPPLVFPPIYKKPLPKPVPVYKPPVVKPLPPPVPIYKPPVVKPLPPPVPVYKPPVYVPKPPTPVPPIYKPPVYVPKPPTPVPPVYKPPVYVPKPPTPVPPVYKPPVYVPKPPTLVPPVYKPPVYVPKPPTPVPPVYTPPVYQKPVPPFHFIPKPPFPFKKPCPPLPKIVPHVPISFPPLPPHINHP